MSTATYRSLRATIVEGLSTNVRVDEGIIRGAKLIGFESRNGRRYSPVVLKQAVHLYEGAKVNIDHPEGGDPTLPRKYGERFGVIRNAHFVEGQGIFGDCHFNPKHPSAEQVCWDAKNNPEALGFSHNALLKIGASSGGKQTVEAIISVRSMDLVADPATTTSLFESEDYSRMDETTQSPETPTSTDPKAAMRNAFRQMVIAAIDDSSLDMKATMKKIAEIMKAQDKLMGGGLMGGDTSEESGEESLQYKQQITLLKQQLEQYQAKEKQQSLVESIDKALAAHGLDPKNQSHVSELFSKQLLATEGEQDRLALIKDRAALLGVGSRRSSGATYTPPVTDATEQIDVKTFASKLLG